jgi:hypothetical protein
MIWILSTNMGIPFSTLLGSLAIVVRVEINLANETYYSVALA